MTPNATKDMKTLVPKGSQNEAKEGKKKDPPPLNVAPQIGGGSFDGDVDCVIFKHGKSVEN